MLPTFYCTQNNNISSLGSMNGYTALHILHMGGNMQLRATIPSSLADSLLLVDWQSASSL
jgi:hypothetical protein